MKIGDRVRIIESVIVYHHPEHKKQPFDLKGMEGEIIDIVTTWQGRPVSANLPVLVQFEKRFKAHFRDNEVEVTEVAEK
ncbi:ferredoxin-thioredoxin reductase variable chain [Crocosphaera sp. Alani8]|uniref:ferredoxin-thioredoxin reductase variable chain n=1 Tax=Crocosphaera sp. Alani8 TaxID=3038952 RepID=UPI00313D0CBD